MSEYTESLVNIHREAKLNEERYNNQGCLMRIIQYDNARNIVVEFQDDYRATINTLYKNFKLGNIKNPYYPDVFGVGMIGTKYQSKINNKYVKEYETWVQMLRRCYSRKHKENHSTYENVSCCKEWLLYENFYEWLHSQENFEKWYCGIKWCLDKDILIKNNKVYSPETCCLVSNDLNLIFGRKNVKRKKLPIGVFEHKSGYIALCRNPLKNSETEYLGIFKTPEQAFQAYKFYKENIIKQVAQIEYTNGNITRACYDAMMNYVVEITD